MYFIRQFLSTLNEQLARLEEGDDQAWAFLVSKVVIHRDRTAEFVFRSEITITVKAE